MILIFSQDHIEEPTNRIIDWLIYSRANFKRINGNQFSIRKNLYFNLENQIIEYNNGIIDVRDVNIVWYRRWSPIKNRSSFIDYTADKKLSKDEINLFDNYNKYLNSEYTELIKYFFDSFSEKRSIPNITKVKGNLNKLTVLKLAKRNGLNIPPTIITNDKNTVQSFLKEQKSIITKPISEVSILLYEEEEIRMLTKVVSANDVAEMPDFFFPTLYQKAILKTFEIRIFFIEEHYYPMAIFSQKDQETSSDFRNYNQEVPNRCIPFNVPGDILQKLRSLMGNLELNTGSIDMIYDENENKYIFLEVNPVGQFGMVSDPCNYNIEKKISEILCEYDK